MAVQRQMHLCRSHGGSALEKLHSTKCGGLSNSLKSHLKLHLQSSLQIEAIIALSETQTGTHCRSHIATQLALLSLLSVSLLSLLSLSLGKAVCTNTQVQWVGLFSEVLRIYTQWLPHRSPNYPNHPFGAAKGAHKGSLLSVAYLRQPFCIYSENF